MGKYLTTPKNDLISCELRGQSGECLLSYKLAKLILSGRGVLKNPIRTPPGSTTSTGEGGREGGRDYTHTHAQHNDDDDDDDYTNQQFIMML